MPVRYQNSSLSFGKRDVLRSIDLGRAAPQHMLPISPPETEGVTPGIATDSRLLHSRTSSQSPHDGLQVTPPTATEESPSRYRGSPSMSYPKSGLQFRSHPAPNRPSRWLVVVMPPSSLNSEPALGHTLSTSPPGRFQSGVLVPLFPTLYGQLAAISKEFGLPSTTGVCIYLHVSDRGLSMAPRISDEAWQLLWGHYFIPDEGAPSYPSHQLPICGQIEFDVDIRKARWYESWVNGHVRHPSLEAVIPPAVAQSLSKWYHDATKDRDEEPDAHNDTTSVHGKHIPRPLALALGRREGSVRSTQKYKAVNGRDGDVESTRSRAVPHRLSPVMQAEEPATAKQRDLNTLVRNWRATTPAVPALPREEGTAKDTLDSPDFELDLDDFQWSISSGGPAWYPGNEYSACAHSVTLEARLEGSVALTPSIATSFGPDDVPTPTFSNVSRYPSPDIAARFIENAPLSPLTATSWGAPLSWPTTPASIERVLSPDLATRAVFSRPQTPMTATSWGAPEHWPASPFESFRPHTPDMGFREQYSRPATPSTATSWGAPEHWPSSPVVYTRPLTPDYAQRVFDEDRPVNFNHARPWVHVWPFCEALKEQSSAKFDHAKPWAHVWPFNEARKEHTPAKFNHAKPWAHVWPFYEVLKEQNPAKFNHAKPWAHVWPFSEVRSEQNSAKFNHSRPWAHVWPFNEARSEHTPAEFNHAKPWAYVWPFFQTTRSGPSPQSAVIPSTYTFLQVYRPVYPHIRDVYPPKSADELEIPKCQSVRLPNTRSYDYPNLVIYPLKGDGEDWSGGPISVKITPTYPVFDLYPAVYPFVCPYPVPGELDNLKIKSVLLGSAAPNYPGFDVYNTGVVARPAPVPRSVRLQVAYPAIALYGDVYPSLTIYPLLVETFNLKAQPVLLQDYPVIGVYRPTSAPVKVEGLSSYGRLSLYPATYPHIQPYPPCDAVELKVKQVLLPSSEYHYPTIGIYGRASQIVVPEPCSVSLRNSYGRFELYPACYPYLEIYPVADSLETKKQSVLLSSQECEYPDLLIYPGCRPGVSTRPQELPVVLPPSFGRLNIYPATYPPEPYPPMDPVELMIQSVLEKNYEYPAIVVYPGCASAGSTNIPMELHTRLPVLYPFFDLYPTVYPFMELYPSAYAERVVPITPEFIYPDIVIYEPVQGFIRPTYVDVKLPRTQGYPSFDLYEPGYPLICPYPVTGRSAKAMTLEVPKLRSVKMTTGRHVAYPNIEPYTPVADRSTPQSVKLSVEYPAFDLYPALESVYPSIEPAARCLKLSPLHHGGYLYPNIVIYQPLDLQAGSALELYKNVKPLGEGDKQFYAQSIFAEKPRKTHVQLYIEVFQSVRRDSTQQVHSGARSLLPPHHCLKRRKTHQELWKEVFPTGLEVVVQPALASPVLELPTFSQTHRLGRARSASMVRTQPAIGISRTQSLRSPQPLPQTSVSPAPLAGRVRAMSRATLKPAVETEPSTRTKQLSLSFLSRSGEGSPSDNKSSASSQVRRPFEPASQRPGIVQRTAHMLTNPDENLGHKPALTGSRLPRRPSKLDRSKFPFA